MLALNWDTRKAPSINSKPLTPSWSMIDKLRFWLHSDKQVSFPLTLTLVAPGGGYFFVQVPIRAGWHEITIPLSSMKAPRPVNWKDIRSIGLNLKGYGQPNPLPEIQLHLTGFEVQPKPGASRIVFNYPSLVTNNWNWRRIAQQGNPIYFVLFSRLQEIQADFTPPAFNNNTWLFRESAEKLLPIAFTAGDSSSPHRGRLDLVRFVIANVDYLISRMDSEGRWWAPGRAFGDPNVNRFVLAPLLDSVNYIRQTPEGESAFIRWRSEGKLVKAVAFQKQAYRKLVPWDFVGIARGKYVNQDAYYALILALSSKLFDRDDELAESAQILETIKNNLLPEGGFHYMGGENESPIYHGLNVTILGRYQTLMQDSLSKSILIQTRPYYPKTFTDSSMPENWSDVWWKQAWELLPPHPQIIVASLTQDSQNIRQMWQGLARSSPHDPTTLMALYAAPYWRNLSPSQTHYPKSYLVASEDIRGVRGRNDDFYYGFTQGRGARNTFVGAQMDASSAMNPLVGAFCGANVEVTLENGSILALSEAKDSSARAIRPNSAAALGVQYSLQPYRYNGWPVPPDVESPFQVTQTWIASERGMMGQIRLEAVRDISTEKVSFFLALGPHEIVSQGPSVWRSGAMKVAVLESSQLNARITKTPPHTPRKGGPWQGIELTAPAGSLSSGTLYTLVVWVGPARAQVPSDFVRSKDNAWMVRYPDAKTIGLFYNDGGEAETFSPRGMPSLTVGPQQIQLWESP